MWWQWRIHAERLAHAGTLLAAVVEKDGGLDTSTLALPDAAIAVLLCLPPMCGAVAPAESSCRTRRRRKLLDATHLRHELHHVDSIIKDIAKASHDMLYAAAARLRGR